MLMGNQDRKHWNAFVKTLMNIRVP